MFHARHSLALTAVAAAIAAAFALTQPTTAAPSTTLDNLQAAFNGESNAHAKYVEYAKRADQDGFAGAAALFRAAAQAEEYHARNHGEVIKKMGAEPKATIKLPEIKATSENLKDALAGETYERDTMYPGFIAEAKASANKDALRSFNFAISAEAEHAKLYADASANQQDWKAAKKFYVCPLCGKTVPTVDFSKCPVCFTAGDKFVPVA